MALELQTRFAVRSATPGADERLVELVAESMLAKQRRAKVAVIGAERADWLAEQLRQLKARARVVVVDPARGRSRLHVSLSARGPFHGIIDLTGGSSIAQVSRFLDLFMHLEQGGAFFTPVIERHPATADDTTETPRSDDPLLRDLQLDGLLEAAKQIRIDGTATATERELAWLGVVAGKTTIVGEGLLVRSTRRMQPTLRDREINPILRRRPKLGALLETRAGVEFASRCDYADSSATHPDDAFVDEYRYPVFDVPELYLRRYDRPTCSRGQVVESAGLIMPDTFRHHRRPRLVNTYLYEAAQLFTALKRPAVDPIGLHGAYFHFDSEWPGHYGHTMTEQISRWWALDRVRAIEPDIRLLLTLPKSRPEQRLQEWELDLFATHGLRARDVVIMDAPVQPERLYAATPMFSCPEYVHPDITSVWDKIANATPTASPLRADKIFCTRPASLKRSCRNVAQVEDYFAGRGFAVVQPETFPLAEQIALFRDAEVIAGFAGSGLFTMAFCPTPKTVIMISPESYTARNEYLFAAVRGHRLRVAWSRPDIPHPPGRWTNEAFGSSFAVDFEREGRFLDQVLDELDSQA